MEVAHNRWLKAHEVFRILRFPDGLPVMTQYNGLPSHGDMFIVHRASFPRWKQDGHSYKLRRTGKGIREDREKYFDSNDSVICAYVHGAEVVSFHRRAYWLVSTPDTILVHYIDDQQVESGSTQVSSSESFCSSEELEDAFRVEIVDFSPDWDDVSGGAKVLFCVSSNAQIQDSRLLFAAFGDLRVQLEQVQPGVMRCRAPPHCTGFVNLYLLYDSQEISVTRKQFEYRQVSRKRLEPTTVAWSSMSDHDFKVRLVEHLTSFDNTVEWQSESSDDFNIDDLITQFVVRMQKSGQDLTELDEYGCSLIHYCAAVNLSKPLQYFGEAQLNVRSADGCTPLDVATIRGKVDAIAVLMEGGADAKFSDMSTAGEIVRSSLSSDQMLSEEELIRRVKVIQEDVQTWLKRRHYNDVQRATSTLKRAVKTLILRKKFLCQKKAAKLIQKTYRSWLMDKARLSA